MEKKVFDKMITFIYVTDLRRSELFYEEIMGFPLRLDQGACRIVETNQQGGGLLGYCVKDQSSSNHEGRCTITLVTSDVDEWYGYLVTRGVEVHEPPKYNQKFNIYHFYFRDPDGNLLEIQEFLDPAWQE